MLSKKVQNLTPYVAGEQPKGGYIKLNTNENALAPSSAVAEALATFNANTLRLYPDPESKALTEAIANLEGVDPKNIILGNGSDELLAFAFFALFEENVAFADVTYSFYPVYANLYNLKTRLFGLDKNFKVNLNDYKDKSLGGIVIANPNAPTSLSVPHTSLLDLVKSVSCNVLVDEAYIDFATATESLARVAPTVDNLLVVKTFSKSYALAGLRIGYAVGCKELIEGLNRVKNCFNSYTIDRVCQEVALAAVADRAHFNKTIQSIRDTRQKTIAQLQALGHQVLPADANFIFVKHKSLHGKVVYDTLKQNGILVRHFASNPRTAPFVRVTIGTQSEMDAFLQQYQAL